jgi:hypothetical protein
MGIESVTPSQIAALSNSPTNQNDVEKQLDDLENTNPKLNMQRTLVRQLFTKQGDEEDSQKSVEVPAKQDVQPRDSVAISQQAMEMYQRQSVEGQVQTADGTVTFRFEHEAMLRVEVQEVDSNQQPKQADPLVIDLDGNGVSLTDVTKNQGVLFDITGTGSPVGTSWVNPNDGILVFDRNGSGMIDSGRELFGEQNGAANGLEELAKFDSDGGGSIDANDAIYSKLQVWRDLNQNGLSESGELASLSSYGITSISLASTKAQDQIAGNLVTGYSAYQTASGRSGQVGEALLNYFG